MAAGRRAESLRGVLGLSEVYGAALAAAAGPAAAAQVTEHVMVVSRGGDIRSLVARTVVHAMRTAPHAAFAPVPEPEREVIALARLARYSVDEIADLLGIAPAEARARMTRGLRSLT